MAWIIRALLQSDSNVSLMLLAVALGGKKKKISDMTAKLNGLSILYKRYLCSSESDIETERCRKSLSQDALQANYRDVNKPCQSWDSKSHLLDQFFKKLLFSKLRKIKTQSHCFSFPLLLLLLPPSFPWLLVLLPPGLSGQQPLTA